MARTLWAEDRGGGAEGMEAVAGCILNRVKTPGWWGKTTVEVCLHQGQFSAWFWGDANFIKLITVDERDPSYALALMVARTALRGDPINTVNGADHYFAKSMKTIPGWAFGKEPVCETVDHLFFKLGLRA